MLRFAASSMLVGALLGATSLHAQAINGSPLIGPGLSPSVLAVKGPAASRHHPNVQTVTPASSIEQPGDSGRRAHTHYKLLVPPPAAQTFARPQATTVTAGSPPFAGYYYETPASLACIYRLVQPTNGCDPNQLTAHTLGGTHAIAIVDAYDEPSAAADLAAYSQQFGLPAPDLTKVYATGSQPAYNAGWGGEIDLDIEMAHAMAPGAKIYLVEAASPDFADLNVAVDKAYALVQAAGGGEVSMSFGGSEFTEEAAYDSHFNKAGKVVFFASTGDAPGTNYPSVSPYVVAVGGTSTSRDQTPGATFGQFLEETVWASTGGGQSAVIPRPDYQAPLANHFPANARSVPDISAVGNPTTGVWTYIEGKWYIVGGTSVSAPLMAGITNRWGSFRDSSVAQLTYMYSKLGSISYFDVNKGVCGPYVGFFANRKTVGDLANAYDLCSGLGTPRGASGL